MSDPLRFPRDFVWGIATSAPQIEGAAAEGGRGESIWDRFASTPGRVEDGSDARVACDHYHRWREDVDRIGWLGVGAYRFSLSWVRVLPDGRPPANPAGLDFYDALVDALLANGIEPFVTLNHWDLPQELQDAGGWATRETVDRFADYAGVAAARLGDRVRRWVTHNEPWCIATLGHEQGIHAPGHRDPRESLRVAHHLLVSHGRATSRIREQAPGAEVGIVLNLTPADPASESEADRDAARQFDGLFNRWYLDPLHRGAYPEDALRDRIRWGHLGGPDLPFVLEGDLREVATPTDFLGVNYYSRAVLRAGEDGRPIGVPPPRADRITDMGWEVHPDGLESLLLRLHREYAPPRIYITENGAAYGDGPDPTGRIEDLRRIRYLDEHLRAARRALAAGVPLAGYFVWSLLDNFEWSHGYERRFGLFWVDFATQERIAKESAHWYRRTVRAGALSDEGVPR